MKKYLTTAVAALVSLFAVAQSEDPVLMLINGKEVKRSEFEYALNKNNATLGEDKKVVKDYLPMYIDFKLKVAEAETLGLDTLSTFLQELADNRAQIAEPYLIDNKYIEREAHNIYAKDSATIGVDGFLNLSHIFVPVNQKATPSEEAAIKARVDSAYAALKSGVSLKDAAAAINVPLNMLQPFEIIRGQAYKEFEDVAFSLADSSYSAPLRSPAGYHIIMRYGQRPFGQYSEYREAIISMLEQRGIRNVAKLMKGKELAKEFGGGITPEEALAREDSCLETKYPDFGHLMTEYRDGLLFFEVCTREVWNKAAEDSTGLAKFFKKNKKRYKFENPKYRGAVIYANSAEDIAKAQTLLKDAPQDKYRDILKENFYVDSVYTIRLEMGIFSVGDNAWVDKLAFGQGDGGKMKRGFELVDVVGEMLDAPESYKDVHGLVLNDYQRFLEEKWVKKLRKKYKYEVDKEVLKTVNNHN
ncbi:MAG: peptidylprolyl isomerase [Bacteroidaceae bacterium]|nr:peptidylprolyl isomerase [Bacteroidaceae bacterium]